jgi:hypothetical protein
MDVSWYQDTGPDYLINYKHAMSDPGQDVEEAERLFRDFVCEKLNAAQAAPSSYDAMRELGQGIHAIADSMSPSHRGFQPYSGKTLSDIYRHRAAESSILPQDLKVTVERVQGYYHDFAFGSECSCKY